MGGLRLDAQSRRGPWWLWGLVPVSSALCLALKGARPGEPVGECGLRAGLACDCYVGKSLGLSQAMDSGPRDGRRQGEVYVGSQEREV